jgi:hypothetical protein
MYSTSYRNYRVEHVRELLDAITRQRSKKCKALRLAREDDITAVHG